MPRARSLLLLLALAPLGSLALTGCPRGDAAPDAGPPPPKPPRVVSEDIMARSPETSRARVRHILVGWDETVAAKRDARAANRTQAQAEALIRELLDRARHGEDFTKLMATYSEDTDSARLGVVFEVRPDGKFEPEFQALALRLKVGELGVVRSAYGLHLIQRVE